MDETLRVNLSVLKLLVPVSLDAFEQGTQRLLLFLSQEGFLLLYVKLEQFLGLLGLFLFHLLALELEEFCLLVPLSVGELLCLVLLFHKFA